MSKIGLRAARANAGLTLEEVGKVIGKSAYTIAKYEKGESVPKWDVFNKLCNLYGFNVDDIFLPEQ